MNKVEMTEAIILAKKEKGLTWQAIADELGMGDVWVTSACFGMNKMNEEQASKLCSTLGLGADVKDALQEFCHKDFPKTVPTDPVIYRLYEIVGVYGDTIKALIHEKLGDGIMSAIDFNMTIDKEENPAGDRIVVTMNGKFLPYKSW